MSITPKNWDAFQHYKDRSPAWIKLHRGLLDDFAFSRLPVASRALAPLLWLLASEYEGGKITATVDEIAFRLHINDAELIEAIKPLIEAKFFSDDSGSLADDKQTAIPEKEREKQEKIEKKETREIALLDDDWPQAFKAEFWEMFPNKVGKADALAVLERVRKRGVSWELIVRGLISYIRDKPPDRPWCNPATWLRQDRWEDQPANLSKDNGKTGDIIAAADNLVSIIDSFGGRPREADAIRSPEGAADVWLLPQGGS